jgi:hypothetical protein
MSLELPNAPVAPAKPAAPAALVAPAEPRFTFTPRPRRTTQQEINRERREKEALNQKLLMRLVTERLNAPDGRFARALMRIVNRNVGARFARLGLK